jgi:branched-chain amino acid transport system substrate-binding protein
MAKAKSTEPIKVAAALSGMRTQSVFNGEIEVRKSDHQLQQALFITVWGQVDKKYNYSMENTGMTMIPVKQYPNFVSSTPTSCQMKRPS